MIDYLKNPIVQGYIKANNFGRLLDMHFDVVGPGEVVYTMKINESHLATPIAAHGGSICALLDATMGVCALSQVLADNRVVSTLELKISFISPALEGDLLSGTAKIIKSGKRILFVEGEILNQNGGIVAVASGTFNSYPSEKAGF